MTKAAIARGAGPDAFVCRFVLGKVQLEVVACGAARDGDPPARQLASFDHGGVHFLVREVEGGRPATDPLGEILTTREREIARLVASGLRNKQIAYELHLSEYTIAAYIKHICYKLQVRNRTAMVTRCSQLGAAPPGELADPACRGRAAPREAP